MKLPVHTVGFAIVDHALRPFSLALFTAKGRVRAEESGYGLHFTKLDMSFFVHRAFDRISGQNGFAVSEVSTGLRVVWSPEQSDVVSKAQDRLNAELRKGRNNFLRRVESHQKIEDASRGFTGKLVKKSDL